MGDLSRDFNRLEFDCGDGCGLFIENRRLIRGLQKLRDMVGPIHINSGTRCAAHNAAVGGAPGSKHLLGKAADIWAYGCTWQTLAHLAETVTEFKNGGIGRYATKHFVHLDVGPRRRWNK
jgi:uncharacterized protein YcbK (DUF882 family)